MLQHDKEPFLIYIFYVSLHLHTIWSRHRAMHLRA